MSEPASSPLYLGIDLGGTNIKAGVVDDNGQPLAEVKRKTEASRGPEHGVERIRETALAAVQEASTTLDGITAIGLASPGPMDIPAGKLRVPSNLPGWDHFPLRDAVADALGRPVTFQNDASAAAYGEFWAGAGEKADSLVLWTLGTGVGSGIIYQDVIIEGAHSFASECGHMIIDMDGGRRCIGTGQFGTLEAYAGARGLVQHATESIASGYPTLLKKWIQEDGETLTPLLIARAAEEGDELAEELVMEVARCLGVGTVNIMHVLNPAIIAIGGAMTFGKHESALGRRFLQRVKDEVFARAFEVPATQTDIDFATLGGSAGFIGAAGCARQARRQDPSLSGQTE